MVFLGLAIAAGLYIVSRTFNLYLTFLTLRYLVGVSIVIFVIIFQVEIRKYFEFLGFVGTRQIKVGPLAPRSPLTAEIMQSCVQMAQAKVGALIVIQGKDNLDSLIEGGVSLDGVISEEVILSVFDPHSQGHDGALIIDNNRISKFGTQLPLSTNFKEIGKRGTRHGAALGLSENADALCIVVSEEKGKISICRDGKLKVLKKFDDLERELNKFIKLKFSVSTEKSFTRMIKNNFWLKFGAVFSAIVIWSFTAYQAGVVEKSFEVPLSLENIPNDVLIENYSPKELTVIVSGRGDSIFANISTEDFEIVYDATELTDGVHKETFDRKDIVIPSNLTLISFEPESFLLTSKKYFSTKIPVEPKIIGEVPQGFELKATVVTPDLVGIWVRKDEAAPTELATETIDITELTESAIVPVKLIVPEDIRLVNGDAIVNVALTIEE